MTASVNKVDFLNPIEVGELVTLKASINFTGRTSMVVGVRVVSENIQTGKRKHCNSSYFTMVAKDNGKSVPVPGIILNDVTAVRRFARSIRRQEETESRNNAFRESEFKIEDYLDDFKGENAKIDI